MKITVTKTILQPALVTLVSVLGLSLGLGARVSAACVQYDPNSSISTPVFNNFCGVPNGVGDEPDFVRVRQSSNGNVEDNQNNPDYVDALNVACNAGDKFDVHTYIHNNAASGFNNNGAGTSVAHNVALNMTAPLGTTNSSFSFLGAVSASNASGVQDTATLNCGGKQVKLTLVPGTVHLYSQQYNWKDLPDSQVNSTFAIGSPTFGSGELWGCWEYRVVVVYQVTVADIPVIVVPPTTQPPVTPPVTPPTTPPVVVLPPTTPIVATKPRALVNTGPGDLVELFTAVSAGSGAAYHVATSRRRK